MHTIFNGKKCVIAFYQWKRMGVEEDLALLQAINRRVRSIIVDTWGECKEHDHRCRHWEDYPEGRRICEDFCGGGGSGMDTSYTRFYLPKDANLGLAITELLEVQADNPRVTCSVGNEKGGGFCPVRMI